jgi:hypothetical protein
MLEYWVWLNEIYFYMEGMDQKIKSDHHPFLIPNIPLFHYSVGAQAHPYGVKPKPSPLGPDSLLNRYLLAGNLDD